MIYDIAATITRERLPITYESSIIYNIIMSCCSRKLQAKFKFMKHREISTIFALNFLINDFLENGH